MPRSSTEPLSGEANSSLSSPPDVPQPGRLTLPHDLRRQFPVTEGLIYLNHAAVAPLPAPCRAGFEAYLEELVHHGAAHYPGLLLELLTRVRALGAGPIKSKPEEIFIVRSTTQGLGIVATGAPLGPGDNVVLVAREFPANLRPWMPLRRRGVEVRQVEQREGRVLLDELARAVDCHTRVLSISFVQFLSGFRVELAAVAELCRRVDALLVVDAIQGLGVFPLDVEAMGVDFLAADAHKWLLGPEGVGLGYASARALERIEPALEGWLSVQDPFNFFDLEQPLRPNAGRFEEGAYNVAGLHGMEGSLELIRSCGVELIGQRVLQLTDYLVEQLLALGWRVHSPRRAEAEKSGIVLTSKAGVEMAALGRTLAGEGIIVSLRDGALRVSPHAYNTEQELDQLLEILART